MTQAARKNIRVVPTGVEPVTFILMFILTFGGRGFGCFLSSR